MWSVVNSGKKSAKENMDRDEKFLQELKPDDFPILHFYDFEKPSATFGIFMKPELFLTKTHGLDLAKRPTGGGMLFHLWDLTFSVLIPKNHYGYSDDVMKNYKFINELVLQAVEPFVTLSVPDLLVIEYDVMIGGKKIAGSAQRRKKNGFLHQGSISIIAPDFDFLKTLFKEKNLVVEAMKDFTYILTDQDLEKSKQALRDSLQKVICQV
jgi:lipoate-protein ligase A